jgi:hypothetical protein
MKRMDLPPRHSAYRDGEILSRNAEGDLDFGLIGIRVVSTQLNDVSVGLRIPSVGVELSMFPEHFSAKGKRSLISLSDSRFASALRNIGCVRHSTSGRWGARSPCGRRSRATSR